jgi:putative SOS response-associated peptidase YedK
MCGRYVSPDTAAIEAAWQVGRGNGNPFARRFNVLPTSDIPILRFHRREGVIELAQARWGFVPGWWKQPKLPSHAFNARSEEAAGKPMWKDAWRHSRCILPAEGWYEWRAAERADPETGEIKAYRQPHFIHRADRRLVGIGGLVSYRPTPDGKGQLSCAIVTRDAAQSVSEVHDRMPVIVPDGMVSQWLDPAVADPAEVKRMVESADVEFVHHPVSTRLNSAKTDEEAFMDPL